MKVFGQSYRSRLLQTIHGYLDDDQEQLNAGRSIRCPCVPAKRPGKAAWGLLLGISVLWVAVFGYVIYQTVIVSSGVAVPPLLYGGGCCLLWGALVFGVYRSIQNQNPAANLQLSSSQLTVHLADGKTAYYPLRQTEFRFRRSKRGNSARRDPAFYLDLQSCEGKGNTFVHVEEEEQFFAFVVCMSVLCGFHRWDFFDDDTLYQLYHEMYYRDLLQR